MAMTTVYTRKKTTLHTNNNCITAILWYCGLYRGVEFITTISSGATDIWPPYLRVQISYHSFWLCLCIVNHRILPQYYSSSHTSLCYRNMRDLICHSKQGGKKDINLPECNRNQLNRSQLNTVWLNQANLLTG